ncbi:MAG: hypothetical protein HY394_02835 [Candidatus Diapherotrites archaeon]|nr:hypothetical protein [Candidatus Diapherotrites archaeon]
MVKRGHEVDWVECLSETDTLFVRLVYEQDSVELVGFALVYVAELGGKFIEVAKFDAGPHEPVNAHYYFKNPPEKRHLNGEKSIETVDALAGMLREKWVFYRAKFVENHPFI